MRVKGKGTANHGTGPGGLGGAGQRKSLRWPSPRCPQVATRRLRRDRTQPCRSACAPRRSPADIRTRPAACLWQQSRTPRSSPAPPLQPAPQPEPRPAQPSALRRTHTLELAAAFHDPQLPRPRPDPAASLGPRTPAWAPTLVPARPSPWILGHPALDTRRRSTSVPSTRAGVRTHPLRGPRSRVTRAAASAAEQDRSPGPAGPPQRVPRHGSRERSPPSSALQTRAQEERLALWSPVRLPRSPPKRLAPSVNPEEVLIKS